MGSIFSLFHNWLAMKEGLDIFRSLRGSGTKDDGKGSSPETKKEEKPDTSLFGIGTGDEETITRLMDSLIEIYGRIGEEWFLRIVQFFTELEDHQKKDFRLMLHNFKLSNRYFQRFTKETEIPIKGSSPKIVREWEWVLEDYRFTKLDPRVKVLARMAILCGPNGVGSTAVKNSLIAIGVIKKESADAKALRIAGEAKEKALDITYWGLIKHRLEWEEKAMSGGVIHVNRYAELLERWLAANPGKTESKARENEDFHKNCLSAIERRAGEQERELERLKRTFLPPWAKTPLIIIGIMIAISAVVTSII